MYEELLSKHEMIKWEGESSKKPASIVTMLWYHEEEFFPEEPTGFSSLYEILTAESVDQVSIFGPGSVLTSKDDLC